MPLVRSRSSLVAGVAALSVFADAARAQPEDYVDLGVHAEPETLNLTVILTSAQAVQWYRASLPTLRQEGGFLDIRSSWPQPCPEPCAAYIWHPTIIVFDAVGRAIAFDFGSNNEFQEFMLSFGCADPRPPVCMFREGSMPDEGQWLCDLRPYSGQDGELSAGEYWIAVGNSIHPVQGVAWGAASTISPLNPGRRVDFWFRIQPPDIPYCDADFNWDGSTDQDDVMYLANVLAGGDNPTGRWADYNRDGSADQDDLLALVHTIAGGGCP